MLVSVLRMPPISRMRSSTSDSSRVELASISASRSQRPLVSCRATTPGSPSRLAITWRVVVPWPAGGPSDFVARKQQPDMAKALGQPVVIDNIGGAGGAIGIQKNVSAAAMAAHPKLSGFEFDSWAGVAVPRHTPEAVANRINQAVYDALKNPEIRGAFEDTGNLIVNPTSVADLDRVYREEVTRYQAIARSISFQPQ
jgi:tripartite-type tricarboxylate transporter receptor subunit TctC